MFIYHTKNTLIYSLYVSEPMLFKCGNRKLNENCAFFVELSTDKKVKYKIKYEVFIM